MNPHSAQPTTPIAMLKSFGKNRNLILQLASREIKSRYKGSFLGLSWSFINPLLMLTIYTFVFTVAFKARWGVETENNKAEFALVLFTGLILHTLLAEILTNAPTLILNNTNYVKKVVFPLEILTLVNLISSFFHSLISFFVLFIALIIFSGTPSYVAILTPLTVFPIMPISLGLGWIIASLGVYIRDISQFIGFLITALIFISPIFYPLEALPEKFRIFLFLNPLTIPVEQTRLVLLFGEMPNWTSYFLYTLISFIVCFMGFWFFQKTRRGFADVI